VGFVIAFSIDWGIGAANRELTKLGAKAHRAHWKNWLMPGYAIPKAIMLAWVLIFLEHFKWFPRPAA